MRIDMGFLAAVLLLSGISLAGEGNGSSGGGHIYGDQINPWFLDNTHKATYCIQASDDFSLLPQARLEQSVREALNFWITKFSEKKSSFRHANGAEVKLATQDFVHTSCDSQTDIKFQFGFLTNSQIKSHASYKQSVGFAHRTHYDKVNMRGRGYIYIAGERGKFRPSSRNLRDRFWSNDNGQSLTLALVHELGHVFGIQDQFSVAPYPDTDIMSAIFAEILTSRITSYRVDQLQDYSPLGCVTYRHITTTTSYAGPGFNKDLQEFLGTTNVEGVLSIRWLGNQIELSTGAGNISRSLGVVNLSTHNAREVDQRSLIKLWFPNEQRVFSGVNTNRTPSYHPLYNVANELVLRDLVFKRVDGQERKITATLKIGNGCRATIAASINNNLYLDLAATY